MTSLHRLVRQQATRTPDADAVVSGDRRISYAELDFMAETLAHRLVTLGVAPEVPVGLCLRRTVDLAVGVLAVLKAGGACVPLDPAYPAERLAFMMEDVAVPLVVTARELVNVLPPSTATVVCLEELLVPALGAPLPDLHPQNLAWVTYTSGSTGRPKGVGLCHGPLANLAREIGRRLDLTAEDRVLQFAPLGFSVAAEEIFSTWLAGACLVLDPDDGLSDTTWLHTLLEREKVTVVQLTPTYWYEWLRELDRDGVLVPPSSLRLLVVGSEEVSTARVADWAETGVRLVQEYGASEATVSQLLYEPVASADEIRTWPRLPIGTPLAGIHPYVLDENLRPVEDGQTGELYIGGPNLARGYIGQPEMTAERFVADPFCTRPGGRMYRTGDLARRLPTGDLEFLGRGDQQIKVNGVRIEPAEVETAISAYPDVVACAVVAADTGIGRRQLVAFVVWKGRPDEAGLRRSVAAKLAPHMVPARFLPVSAIPVNPHGKVDRQALRSSLPTTTETAPLTPLQAALAGIWARALGVQQVSLDDDFFALGGDSLLATRLTADIRAALGTEIRQRTVFSSPTVAGLAASIEAARSAGATGPPTTEARRAPLAPAQERLWVLHQASSAPAAYNEPVALRLTGDLDHPALREAVRQVVRRQAALRTSIVREGGKPVQVVLPPSEADDLDVPVIDAADRSADEVLALAAESVAIPFDLADGPLLRAVLLRVADREHMLVVTFHHIVFDGWSADVFLRDLAELYAAGSSDRPASLPALTMEYADHAESQARLSWEEQLAYWRERLDGAVGSTLAVQPASSSGPGEGLAFAIPPELVSQVRALASHARVTPFMVFLAALAVLVHRRTGTRDVLIGTLVSGRDRPGTEDLIGLFINTLALRIGLPDRPGFAEVLAEVKASTLAAFAHQDVPYQRVLQERGAAPSPLLHLGLTYGGAPARPPRLPGLGTSIEHVTTPGVKLDAALMLDETDEGGVTGLLEYNPGALDATEAQHCVAEYLRILYEVTPIRRLG